MDEERLSKLAQQLDAVAEQDEIQIEEEKRLAALRRESAFELYVICSNLVRSLNSRAKKGRLELSPPEFTADSFQESGPNLFQINVSGRIVDIAFEATDALTSTEDFLRPYTVEGSIRWFNQDALETLGIHEQLLFLCVEGEELSWIHFNPITHREGPFDEDFLMGLLEALLK
jgi:hypothetical protein